MKAMVRKQLRKLPFQLFWWAEETKYLFSWQPYIFQRSNFIKSVLFVIDLLQLWINTKVNHPFTQLKGVGVYLFISSQGHFSKVLQFLIKHTVFHSYDYCKIPKNIWAYFLIINLIPKDDTTLYNLAIIMKENWNKLYNYPFISLGYVNGTWF